MSRAISGCVVLLTLALATSIIATAQADPDVVIFYREGCHDCERIDQVLQELHDRFPSLSIRHIEENEPDGQLMWALSAEYGIFPTKFPVVFVGDEAITGVGLDKELRLRAAIEACMRTGCDSPLVRVEGPRIPWRTYVVAGLIAVFLLLVVIDYAL
jgi:thiol-disulfide isomerase/thioredoxin